MNPQMYAVIRNKAMNGLIGIEGIAKLYDLAAPECYGAPPLYWVAFCDGRGKAEQHKCLRFVLHEDITTILKKAKIRWKQVESEAHRENH